MFETQLRPEQFIAALSFTSRRWHLRCDDTRLRLRQVIDVAWFAFGCSTILPRYSFTVDLPVSGCHIVGTNCVRLHVFFKGQKVNAVTASTVARRQHRLDYI